MPLTLYMRNGNWHFRGTVGPAGKRRLLRGSCKTANQDVAARQIAEIEAGYWKGHFDGPAAVLTFAHACRLYRAAGKADGFLDAVETHIGHTLVRDINEGSVQMTAMTLYPDYSGASLNRAVIVPIQAVINHAAKLKLCPPLRVARYKEEKKVKEPATLEWVEAFRKEAASHLGAFALFMFLTGARPSEAIGVQWEDVDLTAQTVLIRESKASKERVSHLPMPLVIALTELPRVEGRGVFVYQDRKDLRHAWEGAIARAGIKPLTPHCCRHGFATGLLRRGVDVVTVAWLGGWASAAQVLKTYGHATKDPKLTELLTRNQHAPSARDDNSLIKLVKSD